jgi:hypothetical protein
MDTDDLSTEAYDAILIEAEKLTHDLTLHYGLLLQFISCRFLTDFCYTILVCSSSNQRKQDILSLLQ